MNDTTVEILKQLRETDGYVKIGFFDLDVSDDYLQSLLRELARDGFVKTDTAMVNRRGRPPVIYKITPAGEAVLGSVLDDDPGLRPTRNVLQDDKPLGHGERLDWDSFPFEIPPGVTPESLRDASVGSMSVSAVCDELGTDARGAVRVLLVNEGLYDQLHRPEAGRRRAT